MYVGVHDGTQYGFSFPLGRKKSINRQWTVQKTADTPRRGEFQPRRFIGRTFDMTGICAKCSPRVCRLSLLDPVMLDTRSHDRSSHRR